MKRLISKLALRLTLWFLLLSIFPIMVLILFIQSNVSTLILTEYRQNLDNSLHYVVNSINQNGNDPYNTDVIYAQFGNSSEYFILDSDYKFIKSSMASTTGPQEISDFSQEEIAVIQNPDHECHMLDQSKTYFCVIMIPNTSDTLVIIKDAELIINNINALHQKSIVEIAISLFLMVIIGGGIIWLIVGRPIQFLTASAAKIAQGDFSSPIDTDEMSDELSELGNTFNNMSFQLQALVENQQEKIKELNQVKEALEKSQENLRIFFHSINDFVFVINAKEEIVYTNQLIEKQLGYTLDEIIGKNINAIFVQNFQQKNTPFFLSDPKSKETVDGYLIGQHGEMIEIEMKLSNGHWNDQDVIFGTARDISERINSEKEIHKQVQRLESLHKIDLAITGTMDLNITIKVLLDQVNKLLNVQGCTVLLYDPVSTQLNYLLEDGFNEKRNQQYSAHIGEGLAGKAALERKLVVTRNVNYGINGMSHPNYLENRHFQTVYDMPLIAKGELKGILELYSNLPPVEDTDWHTFLATLATQAALAIDNSQLFNDLQRSNTELYFAYDITLEGLVKTLELRDLETRQHSDRTTDMTMNILNLFNFRESLIPHIRRGALLHDIGKMGIPDQILNKPGPLTENEWEIVKQHPLIAYEMISKIPFLRPAINIPYYHHERWDGTGYPHGLIGDQIPLEARIFSVIDVWDAISHDTVYRKAWQRKDALHYIEENAGTQFDPQVVEVFLRFIQEYLHD
jgi:PAS domain S-box-containing protein